MTGDCLPLELCGVSKRWRAADGPILDELELIAELGPAWRFRQRTGLGRQPPADRRGTDPAGARTHSPRVADVEGDRAEFQGRIGLLSATSAGLYGRLTVRDHLGLWSRLAMLPPAVAARCRKRVIDAVALS